MISGIIVYPMTKGVSIMRNPLRVFEKNIDKKKCFDFETIKSIFFYDIFDIFVNRYTWNNLPEEILPMYIEQTLFGMVWAYSSRMILQGMLYESFVIGFTRYL